MTALAVMAALPFVSSARAAPLEQELRINVDGFLTTYTAGNGGVATTPGAILFHGVNITSNVTSNAGSPGSGPALLLGSTLVLMDSDGAAHDVIINVGDTNFTHPTVPPGVLKMTSSLGGSVTIAGASLLAFQSYVDAANGQNTTPASFTTGPQTIYSSGDIGTPGSFALTPATLAIATLASPYSMTSVYSVHLTGSATVNFASNLNLVQAIPEPSSLVISSIGALGMLGYGLRRRKALGA